MKTSQWSAFFFLCHNSSVNFSIVQLFIFCIFFFHVMLTISSQLKILSQDNHKNGTTLLLSCPYDTTTPIQRGYSLPYLKSSLQLMMKFACTTSWFKAKCFSLLGLWVMPSFSCIWSPQLNVCFYSAAPAWQASKGVGDRKERKKSGKFQFGGGGGVDYLRRPVRGGSARKGYLFQASGIWKVREICHLGLWKYPKGLTDEFYGFINSKKPSIFVIDSYLKDSAFAAVKRDAKF